MEKLGAILLKMNAVSKEQLNTAVKEGKRTGEVLGKVLVRLDYIKEAELLKALSQQLNIPYIASFKKITVSEEVIKAIPAKFVWHYKFMPISIENNVLKIAISDPLESWPAEEVRLLLGYNVEPVLIPANEIMNAIRNYYGIGADTVQQILEEKRPEKKAVSAAAKIQDLEKPKEEASVVKLVDQIILAAVKSRATDIHFENYRNKVKVRCRVDGILYDLALPRDINLLYSAIVSRIKIISGLDVVEKRLPQDGRTKVKVQNEYLNLRVSVIPATHGENVVIRILPSQIIYKLERLGFLEKDLVALKTLIHYPNGVIFLVGPTGSGKTSTLYACLTEIKSEDTKIITIEDPVEYELEDMMQIQVNPRIGFNFAQCLRSVLRHDPDVMMVGEVRDIETAELAIRSALTGHLMFSTLHTNDAPSGVARLIDMGVEPFLIVSSVKAFIGQRLVRVICENCKEEHRIKESIDREKIPIKVYYKGKGCEQCGFTGYRGRTAIYELLVVTKDIQDMILRRVSSQELMRQGRELGMMTLRECGWEKVRNGITTPEEVLRVTEIDEIEEV